MRPVFPTVAFLALVAFGASATAHAFLEQASPRVGSQNAGAPAEVRLSFSEPVEPAFCTVTVTGPAGFGGGAGLKAPANDRRVLAIPLRGPTPPGRYAVHWRVVSVDSHVSEGNFRFEVSP